MTTQEKSVLWQRPIHHAFAAIKDEKVSWLELFYDLVYVVSVFQLGNFLSHHAGWGGIFIFAGLFTVIWTNWITTTFYASFFIANDLTHRLLIAVQMYFIVMMAIAINDVSGDGYIMFAVFFVIIRSLLVLMYLRAWINHPESRSISIIFIGLFSLSAVLWLMSTLLPKPYIFWFWGVSIFITQATIVFYWLRLTRKADNNSDNQLIRYRGEHINERMALLTLIVIGESFFKMVIRLSEVGVANISLSMYFSSFIGFMGVFTVWWLYFDFIADGKIKSALGASIYNYCHLPLMMACAMMGVVANGVITDDLLAPLEHNYSLMLAIALIMFLTTVMIVERTIEPKYKHILYTWRLRLIGIAVALATYFISDYLPTIITLFLYTGSVFIQVLTPLIRSLRVKA